jgi:hypothetical protein
MNVTGTIQAILSQKKKGEVWSISPEATVYDAIAMMATRTSALCWSSRTASWSG